MVIELLNQVIDELEGTNHNHYSCEDGWYSCPLSSEGCFNESVDPNVCNCGASEYNTMYDKCIGIIRKAIEELKG